MIVATDLDRTVIYSRAAAGDDPPPLQCVEIYRDAPQSFVTEDAAVTWTELARLGVAVPTTTRTPEQLARVRLPGPAPRYAIASNGGHLLVDGVLDPSWSARVAGRLRDCAPLAAVGERLRAVSGPFVTNLRTASDLFTYAVVDRAALPTGWTDDLAAWCAPRGWRVSVQGRKVYAVPVSLTKAAAAAELVERLGGPLWAAGDSLLDADLLELADAAIRPAHGELADAGFTRDHLAVTAATGVRAGEEVLAWLHARVHEERMAPAWRSGTS